MDSTALRNEVNQFIARVNQIEIDNKANERMKEHLEKELVRLRELIKNDKESLDIATHAIEILRAVSDEAVGKAYRFLEDSLNQALEKMFVNTTRKIKIKEYTRSGQYPQLELELEVGNGIKRSLKTDSGHGIAQIVSVLSILALIVLTKSRRLLVMDEVTSGLSVHNRKVLTDILWAFTEIGFQFVINDHGYIPEGSNCYHLEMVGDVSHVKQHYIATKGVYLQGGSSDTYDYSELANAKVFAVDNNGEMRSSIDTDSIENLTEMDVDSDVNTSNTENVANSGMETANSYKDVAIVSI